MSSTLAFLSNRAFVALIPRGHRLRSRRETYLRPRAGSSRLESKMAHNESAVEMTPLVSEPSLRGASEGSTKGRRTSSTAHIMQAAQRPLSIRPHRSPFLQAVLLKFVAH